MPGIIRYMRQQWGDAQVRSYVRKLEHGIARLAAGVVNVPLLFYTEKVDI